MRLIIQPLVYSSMNYFQHIPSRREDHKRKRMRWLSSTYLRTINSLHWPNYICICLSNFDLELIACYNDRYTVTAVVREQTIYLLSLFRIIKKNIQKSYYIHTYKMQIFMCIKFKIYNFYTWFYE